MKARETTKVSQQCPKGWRANYLHNKDGYLTLRRTNAHSDVIMKFERSGDMERRKVGTLLRSLRGIRNLVDYEEKFPGNQLGRTKGVLLEAERVIRILQTI